VAEALASLTQADCVQLVRDATLPREESDAFEEAFAPAPAPNASGAAVAAAENEFVREARSMLREQARAGGLRSVLNIFMSALMDTEAHEAHCAGTQRAVLHGMAFAASTEEGADCFDVGVLETIFGLAYSADAGVRLQATQLLLKLATAASAGIGKTESVLGFFWSLEGLHGIFSLLASNLGSEQQVVLACWLRLLRQLLSANVGAAERDRLSTLRLTAQLERIEHASATHVCDPADADANARAQEIRRLLDEVRPLLVAAEAADAAAPTRTASEPEQQRDKQWLSRMPSFFRKR
jgi:hypothetical protein